MQKLAKLQPGDFIEIKTNDGTEIMIYVNVDRDNQLTAIPLDKALSHNQVEKIINGLTCSDERRAFYLKVYENLEVVKEGQSFKTTTGVTIEKIDISEKRANTLLLEVATKEINSLEEEKKRIEEKIISLKKQNIKENYKKIKEQISFIKKTP